MPQQIQKRGESKREREKDKERESTNDIKQFQVDLLISGYCLVTDALSF